MWILSETWFIREKTQKPKEDDSWMAWIAIVSVVVGAASNGWGGAAIGFCVALGIVALVEQGKKTP